MKIKITPNEEFIFHICEYNYSYRYFNPFLSVLPLVKLKVIFFSEDLNLNRLFYNISIINRIFDVVLNFREEEYPIIKFEKVIMHEFECEQVSNNYKYTVYFEALRMNVIVSKDQERIKKISELINSGDLMIGSKKNENSSRYNI